MYLVHVRRILLPLGMHRTTCIVMSVGGVWLSSNVTSQDVSVEGRRISFSHQMYTLLFISSLRLGRALLCISTGQLWARHASFANVSKMHSTVGISRFWRLMIVQRTNRRTKASCICMSAIQHTPMKLLAQHQALDVEQHIIHIYNVTDTCQLIYSEHTTHTHVLGEI